MVNTEYISIRFHDFEKNTDIVWFFSFKMYCCKHFLAHLVFQKTWKQPKTSVTASFH